MVEADLKTVDEMDNKEASTYFVFKEKSLIFTVEFWNLNREKKTVPMWWTSQGRKNNSLQVHKDYGMGTR